MLIIDDQNSSVIARIRRYLSFTDGLSTTKNPSVNVSFVILYQRILKVRT